VPVPAPRSAVAGGGMGGAARPGESGPWRGC
jgi:hypothetical protein